MLAGVIYRFLAESDPEYASFLHNEGYLAAEKRFKLFTFSQLMAERRRVTGEKIHFGSTLTGSVSSPVERFLSHFADTLLTEGSTRLVDYKGIKIRGIMCPFRVSGNPALIQIGYECGFGDKNSAGFGMVEI